MTIIVMGDTTTLMIKMIVRAHALKRRNKWSIITEAPPISGDLTVD